MEEIKCPHCEETFKLSSVIKAEISEDIQKSEEEKYRLLLEKEIDERTKEISEQVEAQERNKQEALIKEAELKEVELENLRKEQLDAITRNSNLQNELSNMEIATAKKIEEEKSIIRDNVEKEIVDSQRLVLLEKDKQLELAKKQVEDMQRKLNQGSQQSQGEILEVELEEMLEAEYIYDDIKPVGKGIRGADVIQVVKTNSGNVCGSIIWETKRTKTFTEGWIKKLKEDMLEARAEIAVLVTETMPIGVTDSLLYKDGVYVIKASNSKMLASILRRGLIDVAREKLITSSKESSSELLYTYVTGSEFSQRVESMLSTFNEMNNDIEREKRVYAKNWAKRSAHAARLLDGTANLIGNIQGRIGNSSLQEIKGLDFTEEE